MDRFCWPDVFHKLHLGVQILFSLRTELNVRNYVTFQSFNHLIIYLINQSISLLFNLSIKHSIQEIINQLAYLLELIFPWTNEPMNQWTNEPMNQWTNELMNQWTNEPINQWGQNWFVSASDYSDHLRFWPKYTY